VRDGPLIQRQDLTNEISTLAALPDYRIGLATSALTIAKLEYPDLEVSQYVERLSDMASRLQSRIEKTATPQEQVEEINRLLFEDEGFQGNRSEYYDPRNSLLNQVLDRKLGIPITLSIVYIEVARRAGLPAYGIGFPGHFLTGLLTDKGRILIDPFENGRTLSEDDCRRMLQAQPGRSPFKKSLLDPAWPKQILVRLLRNLKGIYWRLSQEVMALRAIEWILILDPNSAAEVKERGFVRDAMGDVPGALEDLQRYLELAPAAGDEEAVRITIERLKNTKFTVH
jgi:regulator of sirC expression with transglutaminase-like and TPR domain